MKLVQILRGCAALLLLGTPAIAAEPIKIGFSSPDTGGSAASGRQFVMAAQIWAEHVNKAGGLLGRSVQLIHYDDQSSPANVPALKTESPQNGKTLTMSLRQALQTGHVNRVPVIAGVDRDENLVGFPVTAADYTALVEAQYGSHAADVLAHYPLLRFNSPFVAWRTVAHPSPS